MPKLTKKLLVYLDQNFLSEIAKFSTQPRIKPEFGEVFQFLKKGFLEEKSGSPAVMVPRGERGHL